MVFKICTVKGDIPFDALPVGKIIDYPLEKQDYMPFAQFQIALNDDGLHLKLWAFEVSQTSDSQIKAVISLNPAARSYLELTLYGDYSIKLACYDENGNSSIYDSSDITVHHIDGEDLQGIYWGVLAVIPQYIITKLFGKLTLDNSSMVLGNFFKLNTVQRPHYGSFFPTDFTKENPYDISSLKEIPIFVY